MHDLAAWAALVLLAPRGQPVALVTAPSRACVQDTCLDDPWDGGATVWAAEALDPERVALRAGVSEGWRWQMPVDLPVVAPRADLAPLLARTVEAPSLTLRAGIPLAPLGGGRWRWAADGLAGEVQLDPADVRDIVVVDAGAPVDGAIDFGAAALRAEPSSDAALVATLTGCRRCAVVERETLSWARVRVRTPRVDAVGWFEGRTPDYTWFEESNCASQPAPSRGFAERGAAVAWTLGGPVIGHTTGLVEFGLGWPAPWMPLTVRTPWGPMSMFAEHPGLTLLDRWFARLSVPREAVLASRDCPSWDATPDPALPGLTWFTCASDPRRRFGVANGDGETLSGITEGEGRVWREGWVRIVRDHGGPTGLGSGRALSHSGGERYTLLPVQVEADRVTVADVVAADVPPMGERDVFITEGRPRREIGRQWVDGVQVRSGEVSPGHWVDGLVEGTRVDEFGIVLDDPLPRYVLPRGRERAVRIAFVSERSVSAYVAVDGAVRCVTFDRQTGARRDDVLVDEATGRTLRCVAEPGAVRVSPAG